MGNFSGEGVPDLSGANTATPLLFKIFNTIDYNNSGDWFSPPENAEWRQVCSETGLVPGAFCTNLILDGFIPLISSTAPCRHLQEIKVSADSSVSYCAVCAPQNGYVKKLYKVLLPEMQEFYSSNSVAYNSIPPHNSACEKVFKGDGPVINSPTNGSEYFITKKDPEPLQLSATVGSDVAKMYWYINDQFYKTTSAGQKQFFIPSEGPVKISCTDDKGRNRNIFIKVKFVDL